MKNRLSHPLILISIALICMSFQQPALAKVMNSKPFVIPELKQWNGADGNFLPGPSTRIVCATDDQALTKVARALADDYKALMGTTLTVATGRAADGDIVLALGKDRKAGNEGYRMRIDKRVVITAPTATGLYWATRTLLQIAEQSDDHHLPKGDITDKPDFGVRGFMIDCGRKFIPMSYLRHLVRIMGYYKMNTLQVHLNDNGFYPLFQKDWSKTYAAFRMECDTYPGLTARDGYYTKKDFIDLQILAEDNGVNIIPEIDAPAHSLAFSHYDETLGSKEYGMDHLDLKNPKTIPFLDGLWKEYLSGPNPVFRGKIVDIGTDEYSNKDKDVVEAFRALTDHLIKHVESFGKQACFWGSLTHAKGDTPVKSDNVIMGLWYNGYAQPKEMVKQGYKLISIPDGLTYIVPRAGYYYDYLNTKGLYESWTPNQVGNVKFDYNDPAILGGMFAVWNDHVGNGISTKDIHHRVYPALQTLAAKFWTGKDVTVPFADFDKQRLTLSEAPGVNELGRLQKDKFATYEEAVVQPGSTRNIAEIGYDYTVTFHLESVEEAPGTVLFSGPNSTFYLSDPISGQFGYSRDGYLFTFRYRPYPGEKADVVIEGNNRTTRLYVNGRLIDDKSGATLAYNDGKDKMETVETLVFPLAKSGDFKSSVTRLKVVNLIKSPR